jgi:hypothetical protein
MVNCTILVPKEDVFRELEVFLRSRDYRKIETDPAGLTLTAERRDGIFSKKYKVRFVIRPKSSSISDIEITVNPQHASASGNDMERENKIRSRVYFYF